MAAKERRASNPEKVNFWREHVAKWQASGLSQAEHCRQNCVSIKSLGYWKRRFERSRQASSPPVIIPVPRQHLVPPSFGQEEGTLRVHLGHRFTVEICGDFCVPVLEKRKRQKSYFFHMISNYAIEFFSPTFEEDSKWQPKNAEHQIPRRPISGSSM